MDECMVTNSDSTEPVCRVLESGDLAAWDNFVSHHKESSIYHYSIWKHIFKAAFGKQWYVIGASKNGRIYGGFPLVHMKHPLFGNSLVSLPFVNYGGLLVDEKVLLPPLIAEGEKLAKDLGVQCLELRHLENHYPELLARNTKVSMWLNLPRTSAELFQSFKPKLRSQIRKGEKNGLCAKVGGIELLDQFYAVFSQNMRDLGTPVYSKTWFELILKGFPKTARLVVVMDQASQPLAGGFLLGDQGRVEIPWASSLRKFNHLQTNMYLYWNCLRFACEEGYEQFDFGRSSLDSSTFKFKQQWGAFPIQHHWHYWLNGQQEMPEINPQNPKYQLAIALWQRLPLSIANTIGPVLAKHLP